MLSIIQAAGWPIWPLIACSILALALIIERFIALKTARVAPPKLLDEAMTVSAKGVPGPDVVAQLAQNSALGEVLASGLRTLNSEPQATEEDVRASMESTGRAVAHRLEKYLNALATIASAAPLLGLFGTVVGMIEIFGSQGGGNTMSGGNPAQLAHGMARPVGAVPGPVTSAVSAGCHMLLQQSTARLVADGADVLDMLDDEGGELIEDNE